GDSAPLSLPLSAPDSAGALAASSGALTVNSSSVSSSGLLASICSTSWCSSSVDSCSRRMDCCSWGVSARCCDRRTCREGFILPAPALHAEMFAEVDLANVRVLDDVHRRAFGEHASLADDVGAVADAQRLAHVVIGDQHA